MIVVVSDPADPRLEPYRDLKERDLTGRAGRFVAEGKVVLTALIQSGRHDIESVLILRNRLDGLRDLLACLSPAVPIFVVERDVMNAVSGFDMHRGILAIGIKREPQSLNDAVAALPQRATVVVAVGISNHDNIGAIFRNAAAFGADLIVLDQTCCDPYYRKSIRVSVGAVLRVCFVRATDAVTIAETLFRHRFESVALTPSGAETVDAITTRAPRTALFLGTEGDGLPQDLMSRMRTVRIRMAEGWDSLNVAAASAIALHALGE